MASWRQTLALAVVFAVVVATILFLLTGGDPVQNGDGGGGVSSPLSIPVLGVASAGPEVHCDVVASPSGSDSNPGTVDLPLLTAQALVDALAQNQTGCLRAGSYYADQEIKLETPRVTLTSYPGERATLGGRVWVTEDASGATITGLNLDGRNDRLLPSPTINGDGVTISDNDITNHHTTICISVGSPPDTFGRAFRTIIESNRIHDCGALPAANFDHGIYVNSADDTIIRNNLIYDNADRGVQLYPDAQGTLVTGNVIDGNGEGVLFGGGETTASSNNVVEHNVITNSKLRNNVESTWGGPIGTGNIVRENCISGSGYEDGGLGIESPPVGFSASGNQPWRGRAAPCGLPTP